MTKKSSKKDGRQKKIDCRKCAHFFVTWDKKRPYGCKGFGFKSRSIPSLDVFSSSGHDCLQFERKA